MSLGGAACAPAAKRVPGPPQPDIELVFDDVRNFVAAHAALAGRADSAAILDSLYIARGSAGLRLFLEKYPFDARALTQAIHRYPQDYAGVGGRLEWMLDQRDSLRALIRTFGSRVPILAPLPVFFVVGKHDGIGSGSAVGALISIENGAVNPVRANLAEFLIHELTHIQQFSAIGMPRYQSIFSDRKSLLALTIREGIAEFVADLITGRMTQERARRYVTENRSAVWRRFRGEMCGSETGEWMWTRPRDPSVPSFVAYVLGAEIARAYYDRHEDKAAALRALLFVDDYPRFLRESGYALAQGETSEQLSALLRTCPT